MRKLLLIALTTCMLATGGCASIATGILRSALGINKKDEDGLTRRLKKEQRLREERKWIQHWRDNPNENPTMSEAFKDDYR